jgi:NAD(P)-dependent dehydrogenase (short-subunit alcohol dehydrogenase family)
MANVRPPVDGGTVLVTAASAGIGREIAVQLAARAGALVLLARRAGRLEELRASLPTQHPQLKAVILPVDLSDEGDVDRVLTEVNGPVGPVGPVDVLVNNAGVGDQELFDRTDWNHTRQVLHTNVIAIAQLTEALVPSMVRRGRGGVLNIGSGVAGGMTGGPPQFLRISAARCAREALAGFDRGAGLPRPGVPGLDAAAHAAASRAATPPGGPVRRPLPQPGGGRSRGASLSGD